MKKDRHCHPACSVEIALDLIGGKWKGIILFHLLNGKKRFNEIKRLIPSITQRMLTLQLRELEKHQLIKRTVYPVIPPKVEYELTDIGLTLDKLLISLQSWGKNIGKKIIENANEKVNSE